MKIEDRLEILETRLTNLTKHVLKSKTLVKSVTFSHRKKNYTFLVDDTWLDYNLNVVYTLSYTSETSLANKNSIYMSDILGYTDSDTEFTEKDFSRYDNFVGLEYEE